jgi:FKBP-type peptidyl-prolyl cis-trans isomerase (trigger factor)
VGVQILSSAPQRNMISAIERQENGNIILTITVPWTQVASVKATVVDDMTKVASLPGFRKGKAPKKLVEQKLDEEKVKEEVLRKILPQGYVDAVKEHKLNPVISPRIQIVKMEQDKDWQFIATACEAPKIELKDYKENIRKINAKSKIIIPGKDQTPPNLDEIISELLKTVSMQIPQVIIDSETERLLAQTLDEIKRLGLTLDQYLASTGKTIEALKEDYATKAKNDIGLEFILRQIAETEKITVEDKEIEEAINQGKTEEEKKNLGSNKYLLASIIRQQKTLDFLKNL